MKNGFFSEPVNICAAFALAASVAIFSGAGLAQMAPALRLSPPLQEILFAEPPYQEALRKFRELAGSPKGETLTPYDYSMMAMVVWQGAKDRAVTVQDSLDTLVVLHKYCPAPEQRRVIANKVEVLFRPDRGDAFRQALEKMKDVEKDDAVRSYITDALRRIEKKSVPPPAP